MIKQGSPVYENDRRLEMTAYMGPRRGGRRNFNGTYGNPRDPKEGYPEFWTDEVFEDYKKAGLSYLIPEGDAPYGENYTESGPVPEPDFYKSDLYRFMQQARKHDLIVYPSYNKLMDGIRTKYEKLSEEEKEGIRDFVTTVAREFPDICKGIMVTDEPTMKNMPRFQESVSIMREAVPELEYMVSMLPSYGTLQAYDNGNASSQYENQEISYELKEQYYANYVKEYGKLVGEFIFDHYPLYCDRENPLSPLFYRNLELVAQIGKEHNFLTGIVLQSFSMNVQYDFKAGKGLTVPRIPSYEDIRYQVYSSLAFGMKKLGYFTFWQHYNEGYAEAFPTAMVVYDEAEESGYRKTSIYYAVKKVNEQILKFDHVFLRYDWKGSRLIRCSNHEGLSLATCDYEDEWLKDVTSTRDLLIGYMENPEDQRSGYWIVNAHDPFFFEWSETEMTFADATNVKYYRAGKEIETKLDADGKFSVRLGPGEGIFVIPYK